MDHAFRHRFIPKLLVMGALILPFFAHAADGNVPLTQIPYTQDGIPDLSTLKGMNYEDFHSLILKYHQLDRSTAGMDGHVNAAQFYLPSAPPPTSKDEPKEEAPHNVKGFFKSVLRGITSQRVVHQTAPHGFACFVTFSGDTHRINNGQCKIDYQESISGH